VFTCALKNMKGTVPDKFHYLMHQTDLAKAMMDLWSVMKADLTIADVIRPAAGFGPHSTYPTYVGCVVASKDPVAVDATICRMVDLDLDKVPYFGPALERGLGNFAEDMIEIRGRKIEEVFTPIWIPYLQGFDAWPEYNILSENSCSSCQGVVAMNMEKLKALGEYDKNTGATIVLGRKKELPRGVDKRDIILVGDCLKKHRNQGVFVGGCPPLEPFPLWAVVDRKNYTEIDQLDRERMAREDGAFRQHMGKLIKEFEGSEARGD